MSADHADLIARLRDECSQYGSAEFFDLPLDGSLTEAADAIESLVRERDALRVALVKIIDGELAATAEAEREAYTLAAQLCRDKARHDYDLAHAATRRPERAARIAMGNRCDDCAQDIEALRDATPA
jgi:hypothetical protein